MFNKEVSFERHTHNIEEEKLLQQRLSNKSRKRWFFSVNSLFSLEFLQSNFSSYNSVIFVFFYVLLL